MQLVYMSDTRTVAIEELSIVSLKRPIEAEDAKLLPEGSTGTIVGVWKEGVAYIVEFTEPFAALVDLDVDDFEVVQAERSDDGMAGPMGHRGS